MHNFIIRIANTAIIIFFNINKLLIQLNKKLNNIFKLNKKIIN